MSRYKPALMILGIALGVIGWVVMLEMCKMNLANAAPNQYTEITVNNTSSLVGVGVEVKCDWIHKTQRFTYWDYITVRRNSKKILNVAHGLKRCELWGKAVF